MPSTSSPTRSCLRCRRVVPSARPWRRRGRAIPTVYFPLTAVVAVLTLVQGKPAVGAALVGREGIAELPRFSGIELGIAQATVLVAGTALSLPASIFQAIVATDAALQAVR